MAPPPVARSFRPMTRPLRPDLPGSAFHLTTRLQDRAHRFTAPVRDAVIRSLARNILRSDIRLLAFVVMTNHLHLVLLQGRRPLGSFMQPLLTSISRIVHGAHGLEGHVFQRRYRHTLCADMDHLRNAIAYTHANPVRAGLCEEPAAYRWSSHLLYERRGIGARGRILIPVDVATGLNAFTSDPSRARDPRTCYLEYVDSILAPVPGESTLIQSGETGKTTGALHQTRRAPEEAGRPARVPLDEIATGVLRHRPFRSMEEVTSRWGSPARFRVRAEIALAAQRAGWSGRDIARLLKVSESAVSKMLRRATATHSFP